MPRLREVDGLRACAVALMVMDHVLLAAFPGSTWCWVVRGTLGRLAMPLFFGCAGYIWWVLKRSGPSWWRWLDILVSAVLANIACLVLRVPVPDVLAWYLLLTVGARWIVRWPLVALFVGWWQVTMLPVPIGGIHQPGSCLIWLGMGYMYGKSMGHLGVFPRGCGHPVLARIGQYTTSIYVVHLVVLALVFGR